MTAEAKPGNSRSLGVGSFEARFDTQGEQGKRDSRLMKWIEEASGRAKTATT